ncbi:2-dehydro-3-deoxyphosphooctonate aldolase [Sphingomonas sp. Leaf34]|jgi:2-dehydro-3-deoxyphosphooctonate aldolase (KDO 8-P synthase)|uniref:3-deoxy-8-phosphooctulonate synthase n=1 Tax=Sphingomonas sp. Leaf34 TaxID=1736216 RepID=UPI0006FF2685|nr:3-deoxy-8-phosphooctulonate synthase [Sphingomonas sp. Leaf34]KQN31319.1 2-dehydro-3-deoxyphosphooctonate aldolase [Sphingomonas sp. Leaf34]
MTHAPGRHVKVAIRSGTDVTFGADLPFVFVGGPCQIESREHTLRIADFLVGAARTAGVPFVFKASYDKANRTSGTGQRGIGIDDGLRILADVRDRFGCPVLTDVHAVDQVAAVADAVDILQIPAFLSRQTDLLIAAGASGRVVNVKKGQFLAPWDMAAVAAKIASTGNDRIILCDRGASFGYNTLVSDMRALPIMARTGYPVMFDATHSVQAPGGHGDSSGGDRDFAPVLARAAVAAGVAAIFAEAHDDPANAPSDGAIMLPLDWIGPLLSTLVAIDAVVKA